MKTLKILLFALILLALFQTGFGQYQNDDEADSGLLKGYDIYQEDFLRLRYDKYSKQDVLKLKEKLETLKNAKFTDEWEGIYYADYGDSPTFSQLRLQEDAGFAEIYIYTCRPELQFFQFGKMLNTPDYVQLTKEFSTNPNFPKSVKKYVKVKWGEIRYLIAEEDLEKFSEKSVGIYVEPENSDGNIQTTEYWTKNDSDKPVEGLPEFPESYKKFRKSPISAKIIAVGKRMVRDDVTLGRVTFSEAAFYEITINVGTLKGVKTGMQFYVPEIDEVLYINKVRTASATGFITRTINEDKKTEDECWNDKFEIVNCPNVKTNLNVITRVDKPNFNY